MDEDTRIRDRILLAVLPHVAFDGWIDRVVDRGVRDAGFPPDMAFRAFPGGVDDVIRHWSDYGDRRLREDMAARDVEGLTLRDRIATAVRLRISVYAPHKESVRRTIAHLALPVNAGIAARNLARTIDAIWYAAGDRSADFSYYTKRATLVPVYVATVLYWLDDESDDSVETWGFLERRIDGLMRIPKLGGRVAEALRTAGAPARMLGRVVDRARGGRPRFRAARRPLR